MNKPIMKDDHKTNPLAISSEYWLLMGFCSRDEIFPESCIDAPEENDGQANFRAILRTD